MRFAAPLADAAARSAARRRRFIFLRFASGATAFAAAVMPRQASRRRYRQPLMSVFRFLRLLPAAS